MKKRNTNAFTLLELVFVVVVLGILAAIAIPRLDTEKTQEGVDHIISYLRLTQQMALSDHKHQWNNSNWQRQFWQFQIESCAGGSGFAMTVGSDTGGDGDFNSSEALVDPHENKPLHFVNTNPCNKISDKSVSRNVYITYLFGITGVDFTGGCDNRRRIGFDRLGRPHVGFGSSSDPDFSTVMGSACVIQLTFSNGDTKTIQIEPYTGYVHEVGAGES